ncbi:MAG: ATP-binding protein [Betaproteobacteria bacterium]|nr:ATP-binding protein [Betaproteobacteria bacterium]
MKRRLAAAVLRARLARFPAAALLGPRQCGKTTLGRSLSRRYYDAEQPADRIRLDLDWETVAAGRELVVIDEAQAWPELFPRLRSTIDAERRRNGRFLLLGSVSPALMREVSESLAGRLARVELTPFLLGELDKTARKHLWLTGGFPDGGVLRRARFPAWQRDYLALMAQRDLPAWGLAARPQATDRLFHMLATVNGQPWNASALGQSLGLSYHTVNGYLDYLEGAYLVQRLAPWSGNVRKRLVKSARVYLRDSGLLHALLRIGSSTELLRHPGAGASWEGFVIEQILGSLAASGVDTDAHFLRTSDGHEIDLLLTLGSTRVAIEVKLSASVAPQDLSRLEAAADLVAADHRYVVCQTASPAATGTRGVLDLATAIDRLRRLGRGQ